MSPGLLRLRARQIPVGGPAGILNPRSEGDAAPGNGVRSFYPFRRVVTLQKLSLVQWRSPVAAGYCPVQR